MGPISSAEATAASSPPRPAKSSSTSNERPDCDRRESGATENAADPFLARQGVGAGIFRSRGGEWRDIRIGRLEGYHHPRVFVGIAEADEGEPAARPERRAQVRERARGIGEEHDAEPREQQIESGVREGIDSCVGVHEVDAEPWRKPFGGSCQRRRRHVNPEHPTRRSDREPSSIVVSPQPQPISTTSLAWPNRSALDHRSRDR
jgi:hypothetical protein